LFAWNKENVTAEKYTVMYAVQLNHADSYIYSFSTFTVLLILCLKECLLAFCRTALVCGNYIVL
jgi:hypothetical protein